MTGQDEIGARMSLDLNPVDQAITKAKAGFKEFSEHASEHMDRAAMSGRMLHRIFAEIGQISPIAGLAMAGAFSLPMLGLELLTKGIEMLKEHFVEAKKATEEYAKSLADVLGYQNKSFIESQTGGGSAEVRAVKHESDEFEKKRAKMEKDLVDAQNRAEAARQEVIKYRNLGDNNPQVQQGLDFAQKDFAKASAEADRLQKKLDEEIAEQVQRLNYLREADNFEKKAQENAEKAIEDKKREIELNKQLDKLDEERTRNLQRRMQIMADAARGVADIQAAIEQHLMAPFQSSVGEIAGSGGPYASLARRVQFLESIGKRANLSGRKDILDAAKRELYGYDYDPDASRAAGGIAQRDINGAVMPLAHHAGIMEQLRATGAMTPDQSLRLMTEHLAKLSDLASGQGIRMDTND